MSSPFRSRRDRAKPPDSPEALFRQLRPRNRNVRDLLSRQADVVRAYARVPATEPDVAVELPTGAGKTLVGLLLAEYRRLTQGDPVAYLCPTVQLANQVAAKADEYGLDVVTLTGSHSAWVPADRTSYLRAEAVAISTYSHVFNTNPKLGGGTLVLDDAHAGENFVAKLWSITAPHGSQLYSAVLTALSDGLPHSFADRLRAGERSTSLIDDVHLVSPLVVAEQVEFVRDALDAHARDPVDENYWSGKMLDPALEHCVVYFSGREMMIRPLVAPTAHHLPFASASQRIYMSATLGAGGELERAFGVTKVRRLSPETDSHQQGLGRRFFLAPGAALSKERADEVIARAISIAGRAVLIAPSHAAVDEATEACVPSQAVLVRPEEVAAGFEAFTDEEAAVLLLANRYDGIDLPDETCRLIVLSGLPAYAHLQERFFMDKLKAARVTSERIRARITQGAGRCTRNAQDYAAVMLRGQRLVDFVAREEELSALHPELQAELRFGFDNSGTDADLVDMLRRFLDQDDAWRQIESEIGAEADELQRQEAPGTAALDRAAPHEVEAWRALWRGDRETAVRSAQLAADELGGDELAGYRALWLFLAGCWSRLIADEDDSAEAARRADALQGDADAAARMLPWAPRPRSTATPETGRDYDARAAATAAELLRLNVGGRRFEREVNELQEQLAQRGATSFEMGLQRLGTLLGFEAVRPGGTAQPDGVWRLNEDLWVLFEAKTGEHAGNPVSSREVRQALTHHDWVSANLGWPEPRHSVTVLVTPKTRVEQDAASISRDMMMCTQETIEKIGASAVELLRDVRARARGQSDEQVAGMVAAGFVRTGLSTERLLRRLGRQRVRDRR